MRYEVTLRGPRSADHPTGLIETVTVDAESGDEAAVAGWKPHRIIIGVHPAPVEAEKPAKRVKAAA